MLSLDIRNPLLTYSNHWEKDEKGNGEMGCGVGGGGEWWGGEVGVGVGGRGGNRRRRIMKSLPSLGICMRKSLISECRLSQRLDEATSL